MVGNPSLTENQPQVSQISQRSENPKNICGNLMPPLSFFWMICEGYPLLGSSCIVQKTCADLRKI